MINWMETMGMIPAGEEMEITRLGIVNIHS